jgi:hypothetical protein
VAPPNAYRIHPLFISILVLLVVFTLLFTFLVIHESGQISLMIDGSDDPAKKVITLTELKAEAADEQNKILATKAGMELRCREIIRTDMELGKYRYFISDNKVLAGIATSEAPDIEIDGKKVPLKDGAWKLTRDLIAMSVARLESLKQEHDSDVRQRYPKLDEAINSRQEQLQEVQKKISDQEAALKDDQDRLNTQLDKLNGDKDKAAKQVREDYSRRATKIGQHEDKIRTLLELELRWLKTLEPEGEVLEVGVTSPHVVINLGANDKVMPGMLFELFQYERGRYVEKGMLEVTEVKPQIATGRVLNVIDAKKFPLAKGDLIGNPVFSTGRPKVFVVSGEFKTHNKEDLEAFIRQTGGVVRSKLSPGVDFLVAGERSDKDQDNAREYQILAMTEVQLLKYVRQDFKPK